MKTVCHFIILLLQILISFSQLSSRYSSLFRQRKQNNVKNKNLKGKESSVFLYDATICPESLDEAVRHLDKNAVAEMCKIDVRSIASLAGTSKAVLRDIHNLNSVRKISHISSNSFEQNKNGWSTPTVTVDLRNKHPKLSFTDNFIGLLSKSIQENSFKYNIQVRGFKTERGIHADLKRNPNLINRLRKFFGQYSYVY